MATWLKVQCVVMPMYRFALKAKRNMALGQSLRTLTHLSLLNAPSTQRSKDRWISLKMGAPLFKKRVYTMPTKTKLARCVAKKKPTTTVTFLARIFYLSKLMMTISKPFATACQNCPISAAHALWLTWV